jgi:hypothetical protein
MVSQNIVENGDKTTEGISNGKRMLRKVLK